MRVRLPGPHAVPLRWSCFVHLRLRRFPLRLSLLELEDSSKTCYLPNLSLFGAGVGGGDCCVAPSGSRWLLPAPQPLPALRCSPTHSGSGPGHSLGASAGGRACGSRWLGAERREPAPAGAGLDSSRQSARGSLGLVAGAPGAGRLHGCFSQGGGGSRSSAEELTPSQLSGSAAGAVPGLCPLPCGRARPGAG